MLNAPPDSSALLDELEELLAGGRVMVLSGAGLSTESGIPDYRGPTGGKRRGQPMSYREFIGSHAARQRYWAGSHLGWRHVAAARPNAGHNAVARLEAAGIVHGVVTQNVDELHRMAGSRRVVDLHGRLGTVVCLDCGDRRSRVSLAWRLTALNPAFEHNGVRVAPDGDAQVDPAAITSFQVPPCRACGGVLKPDVVFFGESVPRERVQAAWTLVDEARVLLVLGSSLTVMSGYRFVRRAAREGRVVAVINRGATRGDGEATLKVDASLGATLPLLADRLAGCRHGLIRRLPSDRRSSV